MAHSTWPFVSLDAAPMSSSPSTEKKQNWRAVIGLALLFLLQFAIYGWLTFLSQYFAYGSQNNQRPIPLVVSLFLANFGLHLVSLWIANKTR